MNYFYLFNKIIFLLFHLSWFFVFNIVWSEQTVCTVFWLSLCCDPTSLAWGLPLASRSTILHWECMLQGWDCRLPNKWSVHRHWSTQVEKFPLPHYKTHWSFLCFLPGWLQVVVQWSTNSWTYVQRVYWFAQLGKTLLPRAEIWLVALIDVKAYLPTLAVLVI